VQLEPFTREDAAEIVKLSEKYDRCYASDEFYLLAGIDIPSEDYYRGYPQFENGVGMVRSFIEEVKTGENGGFAEVESMGRGGLDNVESMGNGECSNEFSCQTEREKSCKSEKSEPKIMYKNCESESKLIYKNCSKLPYKNCSVVTGELFAPILRQFVGEDVDVYAIENNFYGRSITVAGLLTGQDIIEQLSGKNLKQPVYLPPAMFNTDGLTLDGLTRSELSENLFTEIKIAKTD
jgi:NifB/MoaA-like Fe-S oxidoreductase